MEAPFYIGQDVVALVDLNVFGNHIIKKDADYKIQGLKQCRCGDWKVQVGASLENTPFKTGCLDCRQIEDNVSNVWLSHIGFAPKQSTKLGMSFDDAIKLVSPKEAVKV